MSNITGDNREGLIDLKESSAQAIDPRVVSQLAPDDGRLTDDRAPSEFRKLPLLGGRI